MLIVIRHRSGPLQGREQSVETTSDRITFGRDREVCDVVFPPDETIVARRHFALLRRPSGAWTFDLFGEPYVEVNGVPAELGKAVQSGDTIALGRRGGPSFQVYLGGRGLGDELAPTQAQQKVEAPRAAAARAKRYGQIGIALAVVASFGVSAVLYLTQAQGKRFDQAVAALAADQAKVVAETISPAVREKLLQAAHVVVVRYASGQQTAMGTASPITPNLLATNAHVAALRENLQEGDRMYVRAPGPQGQFYEVVETRSHPGYAAFNTFLAEDPIFVVSSKECPTCFPPVLKASASYDVALLRVADGAQLSPILEVAPPEELEVLKAGTPLALAGYALEGIQGSEVQTIGATPSLFLGMVMAMTDMFNLPADVAMRRLVHHNMPTVGGNSGSPIVNAKGQIVALHNSGSYVTVPEVGRISNAQIRFAQRADLLSDLLSGKAEAALAAERVYWAKQTAAFRRGVDVIVPWIIERRAPPNAGAATKVSEVKYTLSGNDRFKAEKDGKEVTRRQRIHPVKLRNGRPTMWLAYAQASKRLQLYLVMEGQIVERDENGVWFPSVARRPQADQNADIYVVGSDEDVEYTLFEYAWDVPRS